MAMARAIEANKANKTSKASAGASCVTGEPGPRGDVYDKDIDNDFEESKQRNKDGRAARIPAADRFLMSELERLGGRWKVSHNTHQGWWTVTDSKNVMMARSGSREIAEAIAVLPLILCTYSSLANVFAMTEKEREFYQGSREGLYSARMYLEEKSNEGKSNTDAPPKRRQKRSKAG